MWRVWPWSRLYELQKANKGLNRRVRKLEKFKQEHDSRSRSREWWLTKGVPALLTVAVSYGTLATIFHWHV